MTAPGKSDLLELARVGVYAVLQLAGTQRILSRQEIDSQPLATLREMTARVFDGGDHLLTRTIFRILKKTG